MKHMQIFEPAMCCPTGLCGVGVDPELLRISTVLETLKKNGITVERFNLTNAPQVFVTNTLVNNYIKQSGMGGLPLIIVEDEVVIARRYPSNEEFMELLELEPGILGCSPNGKNTNNGCCCSGGNCC